MFNNRGWICPKCDAVMSPSMMYCINCKGNKFEYVVSNNTTGNNDYNIDSLFINNVSNEVIKLCEHGIPVKLNKCIKCNQNNK